MEMKAISICNLVKKKKKTSKLALEPIQHFLGWDSLKCMGNWPSPYFCCPILRCAYSQLSWPNKAEGDKCGWWLCWVNCAVPRNPFTYWSHNSKIDEVHQLHGLTLSSSVAQSVDPVEQDLWKIAGHQKPVIDLIPIHSNLYSCAREWRFQGLFTCWSQKQMCLLVSSVCPDYLDLLHTFTHISSI